MYFICYLFLFSLFSFYGLPLMAKDSPLADHEQREEESLRIKKLSQEYAKFYELPEGVDILEITDQLLNSEHVGEKEKEHIQAFGRRIFVFTYPSDGLKIKGFISLIPQAQNQPLLVFLRGGNRTFGLTNPGMSLTCPQQYTVLATQYRGGISEGEDEFGGQDVNDVKNLIDFIPQLEDKLNMTFQNDKMYLLGGSRGGMQMFLALSRFPELQTRFTKVVSLSGLLDMHECIANRSDMKKMFIKDFGLNEDNQEEWIARRDPLLTADKIQLDLPILIIQGTDDNRVDLEEGRHMVSRLQEHGNQVTYWEIEGGNHCLSNIQERLNMILEWLEQ